MAVTATGADPFAGAGAPSTPPTTTDLLAPPTSTGTPASTATPAGMPTFTAGSGGSSSKTTFGLPNSLDQPIGVPMGQQAGQGVAPKYVKDDEWAPHESSDPDYVRGIQVKMIEAGLLQMKDVHLGLWDGTSAKAYEKVLAEANASGLPASVALDEYVATSASQLPQKAINFDDMAAMAQSVAQGIFGQNLTDAQLTQFQTAFQAAITSSPDGGPQTSAGMTHLAETVLTKEHPGAALHQTAQRMSAILAAPGTTLPGVR